jgi:DNA-binding transcriptional MerR regulator
MAPLMLNRITYKIGSILYNGQILNIERVGKMNQFMKAYTIKEVSKQINVPSGTIRQWEKDLEGLLIIPRTRQGARFYTDKEIDLLKNIKQMRSKNLSKDMIRELMQKHMSMVSENNAANGSDITEPVENNLPAVQDTTPPAPQAAEFDVEGFFHALEAYKQDLIKDVRSEIRNELRTEIVDEVKKDIASNSLQTIKALSLSIQRSKERMKSDLNELSQHVAEASEKTSESFATLSEVSLGTAERVSTISEDVTKLSKGTTKEISNLTSNVTKISNGTKKEVAAIKDNLSKLSKGTTKNLTSLSDSVAKLSKGTTKEMSSLTNALSKLSEGTSEEIQTIAARLDKNSEEFKILTEYLSKNNEMTTTELSTMNEQLAMDREYYLETLKLEREQFRSEIDQRDDIFREMVGSYREAAASKDTAKKWWKIWK